jgi:hypothetical protein
LRFGPRSEALPDLPTVRDFVPGYEARAFYGVGAPKNTPIQIIDKLNRETAPPRLLRFCGWTPPIRIS